MSTREIDLKLVEAQDGPTAEQIRRIHEIVDNEQVKVVFQPIVDLKTQKVFAYEALGRPLTELYAGPLELFSAAVRAGRVAELGRLHREASVRECPAHALFMNIAPNEFDHGWLVRPDDPMFRHRYMVCVEVTESAPLWFFEQVNGVLSELSKKGMKVAVDDLGAGYSNLKYISDLNPDYVKLDRELIANVKQGSRQHQLLKSIVTLCHEMGAKVVCEGIETSLELVLVIESGADYGQGYLLARPGNPPPPIYWPDAMREWD